MTMTQTHLLDETVPTYTHPVNSEGFHASYYEMHGSHGILSPNTFDDPVRLIEEAYHDCLNEDETSSKPSERPKRRSLYAQTEFALSTSETVERMFDVLPQYNAFDPDVTLQTLNDLPPCYIAAGREQSVCLYVWTDQPQTVAKALDDVTDSDSKEESLSHAQGPDSLDGYPDADRYPIPGRAGEDIEEFGGGIPTLVRAWWD